MTTRIASDRYIYEDIYPAFKEATDEKALTADINRTLLNYLAQRNLVLTGESPAAVADLGCGPCDTLIKYLTGVLFPPGFVVRATDYLPEYADTERGESLKTLRAAQAANTVKLVDFSVRAGDAFGGKLLDLLSRPDEAMRRAFSVVYASHFIYHAENFAAVQRLIADVSDNVLAADGICILYHVARTPETFQDFRARFGGPASAAKNSDSTAVTIDDPPALIAAACSKIGLPMHQIEFNSGVRFGSREDEEWLAFKDPRTYNALADSNPAAYEDLKRLYFVVQRAPMEFAADRSATGLNQFIDEVRRAIEANHSILPMNERMQVFCRGDAVPNLAEMLPEALAAAVTRATQGRRF